MAADKARSRKIKDLIRQAGLTCGAHARTTGQPCKNKAYSLVVGNGRCRMHSGMGNSGPKTPEGRQRIVDGMKAYWARRKAALIPLDISKPLDPI